MKVKSGAVLCMRLRRFSVGLRGSERAVCTPLMERPTPFELFSVFFTPHLLNQLAGFTNKKANKWWRDPSKKKHEHIRKWEDTDASEVGA